MKNIICRNTALMLWYVYHCHKLSVVANSTYVAAVSTDPTRDHSARPVPIDPPPHHRRQQPTHQQRNSKTLNSPPPATSRTPPPTARCTTQTPRRKLHCPPSSPTPTQPEPTSRNTPGAAPSVPTHSPPRLDAIVANQPHVLSWPGTSTPRTAQRKANPLVEYIDAAPTQTAAVDRAAPVTNNAPDRLSLGRKRDHHAV